MTNEKTVEVFKAFSDESRVQILGLLKGGEMCGNDILEKMKISQSTLSHHMKLLCESGIVSARKEGKWTHYSVSATGGAEAKKILDNILDVKMEKAVKTAKTKTAEPVKTTVKKAAEKKQHEKKTAEAKPSEPKKEEKKVQKKQLESWLL